ncbi:hypothetical protein [Caulobacter sp. BK020]|uniref:hypothetical protein n=1 Tax=Caulobacter sp. BK020 TaxID=2512117 RepID=UPI00104BC979|nr:hypothetical protein [Caulobacter sp. BK020]TCS14566.1 hypothetical protein EV278_107215 [Caulobacter sp. BK020]
MFHVEQMAIDGKASVCEAFGMRSERLYGPWPLFALALLAAFGLIGSYAFGPMSYVLAGTVLGAASCMVVRSHEKQPLSPDEEAAAREAFDISTAARGWSRGYRSHDSWPDVIRDALAVQGVFAVLALVAWNLGPVL